jgi:hypothetical protein
MGKVDLERPVAESALQDVTCGLIMPISAIDGCSAEHWSDVKLIVKEAVEGIKELHCSVSLVSDADDVGVIQKRIVQNVYSSDLIICDVSGKNPNVMFELGLRLAFDKPAIIIKDDKTDYAFDTGIIEHIQYPRDLHFHRMVEFKAVVQAKAISTYTMSKDNSDHSTFLKNFGKFHVAKLNEDSVSSEKYLIEALNEIQSEVSRLRIALPREFDRRSDRSNKSERDRILGVARLTLVLAQRLKNAPKDEMAKMLRDPEFIDIIEKECQAPTYFGGPKEFREAFNLAVEQILE